MKIRVLKGVYIHLRDGSEKRVIGEDSAAAAAAVGVVVAVIVVAVVDEEIVVVEDKDPDWIEIGFGNWNWGLGSLSRFLREKSNDPFLLQMLLRSDQRVRHGGEIETCLGFNTNNEGSLPESEMWREI
ncbi:hypothetical protein TSUD_183770 [Trifolium subterraneum]|uniref:Uncharacterized protein n=1 Tax=Trifolium subterraneum TaxID=3900 RepID=A0A2Z6N205_TRISU|nr:hypothetical protein TSUD_183770 [Trifolium subterraneum]